MSAFTESKREVAASREAFVRFAWRMRRMLPTWGTENERR
jgi:hypothetical protein